MKRLRDSITYANVVATLALFLALGGGAVYAAGQITGNDVKDDSLTGADVKESTLLVSRVVAKPTGTAHVTTPSSGVTSYPLVGNSWKPAVGEADAITGQITEVNAPGCLSSNATLILKAGGVQVGTGSAVQNGVPGPVTGFLKPAALAATRVLTAEVSGFCFSPIGGPTPTVTSVKLVVVGNR